MMHFRKTIPSFIAAIVFGAALVFPAVGQSVDDTDNLYHPSFLGFGPAFTSGPAPVSGLINPASAADKQRRTLDISYMGLNNFSGDLGHVVNTGYLQPTRWGNLGLTGHFMTDPGLLGLGTAGLISAQISRDVYPEFYLGAGLESSFGSTAQGPIGLAGSLGFVHLPGDLGPLMDLQWAMTLRGIGLQPTVSPLTLSMGTSFAVVDGDPGLIRIQSGVSFPSFQGIRGDIGVEGLFFDALQVETGFHFDLNNPRSLVPTLGLGYRYNPGNPAGKDGKKGEDDPVWRKNSLDLASGGGIVRDSVYAYGLGMNIPFGFIDQDPPEITVTDWGPQHVSPNLDGVKDSLSLDFSLEDQRYIKSFALVITDEEDQVVRRIENKEDRPENRDIKKILADVWSRISTPKQGISVPDQLTWNGVSDDGSTVEDGKYAFTLYATDDNGNRGKAGPYSFTVDNTPPEIQVETMERVDKIFSPDGDGNKDTLTIKQESSKEKQWTAEIINSQDETVRTFTRKNSRVEEVVWDGRNDQGNTVPDGVYQYRISATDEAGNQNSDTLENIIVNTQSTPVVITLDKSHISPNGDGVKDSAFFRLAVPIKQGIRSWDLTLIPEDDEEDTGIPLAGGDVDEAADPAVPSQIEWDGTDAEGNRLDEGTYRGKLVVTYENGNQPKAVSPPVTLDVTPPEAVVEVSAEFLSPNNDGVKDSITFFQDGSDEKQWTGRIVHQDTEETVQSFEWGGRPAEEAEWDGRTEEGRLAPDGKYHYFLEGVDRAGNRLTLGPKDFELVTKETEIHLTPEYKAFSPNGDGNKDVNRLYIQTENRNQVDTYTLTIRREDGEALRTFEGSGRLPERILWDGRTERGTRATDGVYRAELEAVYSYGNEESASTGDILIDTKVPEAEISLENSVFSPNGDGRKDVVRIIQTTSEEQRWNGEIIDEDGDVIREQRWKGKAPSWEWNGKDQAGNRVSDGEYRYHLNAEDQAGNRLEETEGPIELVVRDTPLYLTKNQDGFSPNGDGEDDQIIFSSLAPKPEGMDAWTLSVYSVPGRNGDISRRAEPVWEVSGEGAPPEEIQWEGKDAEDGWYAAQLTAQYRFGNRPQAETSPFLLDTTAPQAEIQVRPKPFSPDNDGRDDELSITMKVEEESAVDSWEMTILDPQGKPFKVFSGTGTPAEEIQWDGRGDNGQLVEAARDYPYEAEFIDAWGNSAVYTGEIPVDVLVIKEGDSYRIRISSIIFKPNSGSMKPDDPEEGIKNNPTLDRLAEILKKYSSYNIRIAGHAADPWYPNANEQQLRNIQVLSKRRAETVRDELIERDIDPDRLSSVGKGASEPVVPHTDTENLWKNRRVEFILEQR